MWGGDWLAEFDSYAPIPKDLNQYDKKRKKNTGMRIKTGGNKSNLVLPF